MRPFIKRFKEWLIWKSKIDSDMPAPKPFKEGEVWWCHVGENIGTETSGKGERFERPVLILRKFDSVSFLGVPLIGKHKYGNWYAPLTLNGKATSVFLAQVRYFDHRRLENRMAAISSEQFIKIRLDFIALVENNTRPTSFQKPGEVGNPKT